METASFTGVIKIIFYFILFYYIFKFVMRLLLPILLKKAVEKAERNMREHDPFNANRASTYEPQEKKPRTSKQVGEYIDYEEIE